MPSIGSIIKRKSALLLDSINPLSSLNILKPDLDNSSIKSFSISEVWNNLISKDQLYGYESLEKFYHLTNLEVYRELLKNNFRSTTIYLTITFVLGVIFIISQFIGFNEIIENGIDYVFTVFGTPAHEYAYRGIKVINASNNNPHSAYKFNIHTNNFNDYDISWSGVKDSIKVNSSGVYISTVSNENCSKDFEISVESIDTPDVYIFNKYGKNVFCFASG